MASPYRPKFSWNRPITSYAKVQAWIGNLVRNRQFQLRSERVRDLQYLDLGCGLNSHENFINMDYLWHPAVDICWDISRGIPLPSATMKGIYTEHCLEHFSLPIAAGLLKECRRILVPGGILRIIVPDGEIYMRTYCQQIDGDSEKRFPFQDSGSFNGLQSPILSVNRVFYQDRDSPYGHRCIYDFHVLNLLLHYCGFDSVSKQDFQKGLDSVLLMDSASRAEESLYVEATASGAD